MELPSFQNSLQPARLPAPNKPSGSCSPVLRLCRIGTRLWVLRHVCLRSVFSAGRFQSTPVGAHLAGWPASFSLAASTAEKFFTWRQSKNFRSGFSISHILYRIYYTAYITFPNRSFLIYGTSVSAAITSFETALGWIK